MSISNRLRPHIKFRKSGEISLTSHITELLDIHVGDAIDITINDKSNDIYLYVAERGCCKADRIRGVTRAASVTKGFMRAQHKRLTSLIIELDGRAPEAFYRVGEPTEIDGVLMLPIINRRNLATPTE
ncbi:MAG: hypothetical protein R3Y22_02690 [Bacteroidales bacterium]